MPAHPCHRKGPFSPVVNLKPAFMTTKSTYRIAVERKRNRIIQLVYMLRAKWHEYEEIKTTIIHSPKTGEGPMSQSMSEILFQAWWSISSILLRWCCPDLESCKRSNQTLLSPVWRLCLFMYKGIIEFVAYWRLRFFKII